MTRLLRGLPFEGYHGDSVPTANSQRRVRVSKYTNLVLSPVSIIENVKDATKTVSKQMGYLREQVPAETMHKVCDQREQRPQNKNLSLNRQRPEVLERGFRCCVLRIVIYRVKARCSSGNRRGSLYLKHISQRLGDRIKNDR